MFCDFMRGRGKEAKESSGRILSGTVENVWKVFDYVFMFHILDNKVCCIFQYLKLSHVIFTYILSHITKLTYYRMRSTLYICSYNSLFM